MRGFVHHVVLTVRNVVAAPLVVLRVLGGRVEDGRADTK